MSSYTPQQILQRICAALYADAGMQLYLDTAADELNATAWGVHYSMGQALLAAHNFTVDQRPNGASGEIKSMSEGNTSLGFGVSTKTTGSELDSTGYGRRFLRLRKLARGPTAQVSGLLPADFADTQPQDYY